MPSRPIYRWKSFWLGIFVLVFIGWAWRISYQFHTRLSCGELVITQREGHTSVRRSATAVLNHFQHTYVGTGKYRFQFVPAPFFVRGRAGDLGPQPDAGKSTYRDEMEWAYQASPKDRWALVLPHWLLMLLFLLSWTAFLAWRWRKLTKVSGNERASQIQSIT